MKAIKFIALVLVVVLLLGTTCLFFACDKGDNPTNVDPIDEEPLEVTYREIDKKEYVNKTLGGLLGQFAGFLSGYEFVFRGADIYVGMPESWFDFLNGPYAGNFSHYEPWDAYRYDRLRVNPDTGMNEVFSDDDFHVDIFNQLVIDEFGTSSYAIKEAWKKYNVSDWGGGGDAMRLVNQYEMLAPYSGSIEGGNQYGWCTEAYIETETLGMNAPGMPQLALELNDTFASNLGYYDSVVWGKFYATMYSLAYFENDIVSVMQKASVVLPEGSHPKQFYDLAVKTYEENKSDYVAAAQIISDARIPLFRIDNAQTDPNVNGAYAVLSWLYGKNSYLDTCKYSSIMGYDGDCTAAICTGVMGILKGFKEGNEEYEKLNSTIYYDGEGVYYNDDGSRYEGAIYQARINSKEYPARQKIDDIIDLYRKNFEKLLVANGGKVKENTYLVPTTQVPCDKSLLFDNYDAEKRTNEGFSTSGATLSVFTESENENSHSGYAGFLLTNSSKGEVYHTFDNLQPGRAYRLTVYVKSTDGNAQASLFARNAKGGNYQEITFQTNSLIGKSFVFRADNSTMQVGIKFADNTAKGAKIAFDDFMLERVSHKILVESSGELKLASGSLAKTVKRPEGVAIGQEVMLYIKYRNYSGVQNVSVLRNGTTFGGVVASNTSATSTNGYDYIAIPYVFEKDSDVVKLTFDGKMYLADFAVIQKTTYMFR